VRLNTKVCNPHFWDDYTRPVAPFNDEILVNLN